MVDSPPARETMDALPTRPKEAEDHAPEPPTDPEPAKDPIHLPTEIILQILSYLPRDHTSQPTLAACALLNKQWHHTTIHRLYEQPRLVGSNFELFVRTVCPSINAHVKKSDLAGLVKVLDLGSIVHQSSKSLTARLLGRTKGSLTAFVAPQASFAVNCFAALSKCKNLQMLNLSLISEAIALYQLAHTIQQLPNLKILYFPRSSNDSERFLANTIQWPQLKELHLSGGLFPQFLYGLGDTEKNISYLPDTLTTLSLTHSPRLTDGSVESLLNFVGPHLTSLTIEDMRSLGPNALDGLLAMCPRLLFLRISLDYITIEFLPLVTDTPPTFRHPLQHLELSTTSSSTTPSDMFFQPSDLVEQIDALPDLRIVRVAKAAGWHEEGLIDDLTELSNLLKDNHAARVAADPAHGDDIVGVWTFNEYETQKGRWMPVSLS